MADPLRSLFSAKPSTGALGSTVVVLGLGRFGASVALELMASGRDVLGIDHDPAVVQSLNGRLTYVVRADTTDEEVMRELSVHEADHVVVAIGGDLAGSVLTTSLMLRFGVTHLWAKANDPRHGAILQQLGVAHVVHPERDMGRRVAHLVLNALDDFVEVEPGFAIVRTSAPQRHLGQDLRSAGLAGETGVRVVALRSGDGWAYPPGHHVLVPEDTLLVAGPTRAVEAFAALR
ncbi:TrkA family potassium uptake protein [Micrococcus sp. NPDC078436]|uniref:potassium channel family protein n=1 Tax=Micrococcus sp. NPDC078436 TaxID=3154960 RepID=UPI00344CADD2